MANENDGAKSAADKFIAGVNAALDGGRTEMRERLTALAVMMQGHMVEFSGKEIAAGRSGINVVEMAIISAVLSGLALKEVPPELKLSIFSASVETMASTAGFKTAPMGG